jgi:hypothetical protein
MYNSLNKLVLIRPSDFVALAGMSLGDCSAALRIFGGSSTLTLKADGIIADFPGFAPDRIEFTNSVIIQGYEAFREEFNELGIKSIESSAGYHLEITGDAQAGSLLGANAQPVLQQRSQNIRDAIFESALRFRLVGKDGKWNAKVTAERSELPDLAENGVFLLRQVVVSDLTGYQTVRQQFDLISSIDDMIFEVLDLDFGSRSGDAD